MFAYGDMQTCSVKFNVLQRVCNDMTRSKFERYEQNQFRYYILQE